MYAVVRFINTEVNPIEVVCGFCFDDPGIVKFIETNAYLEKCSFCPTESSSPIAAPVQQVAEYINDCLKQEYDNADNQVPWDSREGGFLWDTWTTHELLFYELGLSLPNDFPDRELTSSLIRYIDDHLWCDLAGINGSEYEQADYNWHNFCQVTMHHRRYFFSDYRGYEPNLDRPGETLRKTFEYAEQAELFQELPPQTLVFRARWECASDPLQTPEELGPPPPDKAVQSNRMSPAGIVMFYAGESPETALLEAASEEGSFAVGTFEICRPALILDLSNIPEIPSLFESGMEKDGFFTRSALIFLDHVAEQISRRIEKDGREHIDYVPTQVVTEFVRSQYTAGGFRVDGIKYRSSVHEGHNSYVFFATQDNIRTDDSESAFAHQWLRLLEIDHRFVDKAFLAIASH